MADPQTTACQPPSEHAHHEWHWLQSAGGEFIVRAWNRGFWGDGAHLGGVWTPAERLTGWGWKYHAPAVPPEKGVTGNG